MPDYFKKRRGKAGPSKNERKVMRARNAEDQARLAGVLGSRFPSIRSLTVKLVFLDAAQHVLEERTLSYGPADPALFIASCPGRCGTGSFDFGKKISETAAAQLPFSESTAKCPESLYGGADPCGCSVKCRMEMDYIPAPA